MKSRNIIFIAVVLILGTVYLITDSKLYFHGKSKYNILNYSLPLKVNPDYWGTDVSFPVVGLTIKDKYGLVLIGKGSYFVQDEDTITVERIIKYGINEDKLIAFIETDNKRTYFIDYQENTSPQSKNELTYTILDSNTELEGNYKWINIEYDKNKISKLIMVRAYAMLIIIILLIVVPIVFLIRKRKKK